MAGSDMYLKLGDIAGESEDKTLANHIELESYNWGAHHDGTSQFGGGAASGKTSFQDFSFTKKTDKSSPIIMQKCAIGEHIKEAVLKVRKATGKGGQEIFLTVTFTDVLLSSYSVSAGGVGSIQTEHISFNFSKIKYEYKPQKPDGSLDSAVPATYDIKKQVAS